jgi:hypothetical protein
MPVFQFLRENPISKKQRVILGCYQLGLAMNVGSMHVSLLSKGCQFLHRQETDGSWDSICLDCFQVIPGVLSEDDLEDFEREHVCISEDRTRKRIDLTMAW